jgi:formate dehydrogenase assembly factor FdhD
VTGAIKAYSGLNGTGTLLGSFDLAANSGAGYDVWKKGTFTFSGTALSFDLTGSANMVGLDNIASVPEPTSVALMAAGVGVIALSVFRRRRV